jgi:hypothetical protein
MVDRHCNVGLVGKFEFLLVAHVVNILIALVTVFINSGIAFALSLLWANLGTKHRERLEQLLTVDAGDRVDWNVGSLVLKSTVHVNCALNLPASGSEPLNSFKFVPLARLSIVDFHCNVFADLIGAASDHHHKRAQEQG